MFISFFLLIKMLVFLINVLGVHIRAQGFFPSHQNLQKIPTMWRKKRPSIEGVIYITRAYVLAVFHQLDTVEAEQIMFL